MGGHLPDVLKCIDCGKEYTVDYNPADRNRIADFENRLRTAAQQAIDNSHPFHGNYVEITELAGPPIPT
jgi:hypothetical protein